MKISKKALLFLLLLAAAAFAALTLSKRPAAPHASPLQPPKAQDSVHYAMNFFPEKNQLSVTMDWTRAEKSGDALVLLPANHFLSPEASPAASEERFDLCYPNGFSAGSCVPDDVSVNGKPAPYILKNNETLMAVSVPEGARGDIIRVRAVITVPGAKYSFGRQNDLFLLAGCLPVPAPKSEDGEALVPRVLPVGDAVLPDCMNLSFSLNLPEGYTPLFPANAQKSGSTYAADGLVARGLSFAVYKGGYVKTADAAGTRVTVHASDAKEGEAALGTARDALTYFKSVYGVPPLPAFAAVIADFPFDMMAWDGFAVLDSASLGKDGALPLPAARAAARQWFGVVSAADPYTDAWQNEATAEYALLRFVLHRYGDAAYEKLRYLSAEAPMREKQRPDITAASPLDRFYSRDEFLSVARGRGLHMLLTLQDTMDVDGFLREYIRKTAFSRPTRRAFEAALATYAGWDIRPLITDYLDTTL